MKSTSIHSLNADRGLNFIQKIAYLFLNWINNFFPYWNVDNRIVVRPFNNSKIIEEFKNTYKESSVGRRLSDIFWRTLPWDQIVEELGEIHVFDTGCGQGNYGARLMDASKGRLASYTGIDAKARPNWSELTSKYPNFNFIESTSSDISKFVPEKTNLFVTQSAIEHFDDDLKFFELINDFVNKTNKPVIQIHNFPGAAILPLYLFHGVRQYTPRNISKITKIFKNSLVYLYGLGGNSGKLIQWKYFTWPLLILKRRATWSRDIEVYNNEVVRAIETDMVHPSKSPIFWVLIVQSNFKKQIW